MAMPGKLPPTPFMMRPLQSPPIAMSEYNVWHSSRTPDVERQTRDSATAACKQLDIRRAGEGVDNTKLQAYSHWRVRGDVYSESAQAKPEPPPAGKTSVPQKIGVNRSGPAMGFYSTYQ
jgi:hypothetical protein